jgi:cytochrome bd-type quinol oxidase subunit 2
MGLALAVVLQGIQQVEGEGTGQRFEQLVNPVTYLKASGEVLFLALAGSLAITAIFNPTIYADNLLLDRIGYVRRQGSNLLHPP